MSKLKKYKWICVVLLLFFAVTMFFPHTFEGVFKLRPDLSAIDDSALEVHFVDVGQGDSILVRFPNEQTMIIDSGITDYRQKLISYIDNVFLKSNEKGFTYGVLTHSDSDHSSNMSFILDNYSFDTFYRPKQYSTSVEGVTKGVSTKTYAGFVKSLYSADVKNIEYNQTGLTLDICEGCTVKWYSPDLEEYNDNNNYSPIIVIEYLGRRVCLTGDARVENEAEAINNGIGDIDVLKLGHHGSLTSNSVAFLEETLPEYIVVCVGENSYNLPNKTILSRLQDYDQKFNKTAYADMRTTQNNGNIICYVNEDSSINFKCIKSVDEYIFVSWYYIAVGGMVVCLVIILVPNKKYRAKNFKKEK